MTMDQSPTPVTIITGFLGSGKTTLINRMIASDALRRTAVVVNDFGALNIDAQLMVNLEDDQTIRLSNGCICCTIRDDLVSETAALLDRPEPPEAIIIETSGISDPIDVSLAFRDNDRLRIAAIITLIDAEQFNAVEAEHRDLAWNQIGTADLVIVNKTDVAAEPLVQQVHDYVRRVAPKARIIDAVQADVPLSLLLEDYEHLMPEDSAHHHAHDDYFATWEWQTDEPLSATALEHTLANLPVTIYRAKGIIYTGVQRGVVQVVGRRVHIEYADDDTAGQSQIVLIGRQADMQPDALEPLFDRTRQSQSPENPLERLRSRVVSWLRG